MIYHKSAGGVIFNTDLSRVYLIKKIERNEWALPKGHLEEGETSLDAAKREIREETGLRNFIVIGASPCNVTNYQFKDKDGNDNEKTVYFYSIIALDETIEPTPQMKDEGLGGDWLSLEKALEISTIVEVKETIQKAHELVKNLKN